MRSFEKSSISSTAQACAIATPEGRLSFSEVLALWQSSTSFCTEWTRYLAALPYAGYCLETPPLSHDTVIYPFECVFVESLQLAKAVPDPAPFNEYLSQRGSPSSVQFRSLGGDSVLVAPKVRMGISYGHLASFVREASPDESRELWRAVAVAVNSCLGAEPVWLSTAGLGVSWLHVRVDTRPKYYRHRAYANSDFWGAR